MYVYFIMTAVVVGLTYLVQQLAKKDNKKMIIILSLIIILIPSIIAGLRDLSVGTDVNKYVAPNFYYANKSESLQEYSDIVKQEPLYTLLTYFIVKITGSIHWILFVIQLIMTTLVYMAIYRQREKIPMWISMLVYMVFIYTRFLNLIRQGIAVCIIIFSFGYVQNRKPIKFLIAIIIASLFHRTAILAIPIYILYWIINKNDKNSNIILMVSYILLILSVFFYDIVLEWMINLNLLPIKFKSYLGIFKNNTWDVNIFITLYKLSWIIVLAFLYKDMKKINDNKFLFNMLIIDIILVQFSMKIQYADRLSYYFGSIANLILIPQLPELISKSTILNRILDKLPAKLKENLGKENNIKICSKIFIVVWLIVYFYWCFIYKDAGAIYPYRSKILGI